MSKPRPTRPTRIGRKRRTLGWTLLTLGLLVAGVWVASGWCMASWNAGSWSGMISRGGIGFALHNGETPQPLWVRQVSTKRIHGFWFPPVLRVYRASGATPGIDERDDVSYGLFATFTAGGNPPLRRGVTVLFWPFPLLFAASGCSLLLSAAKAYRRSRTDLCQSCGYNRAGLAPGAPCPECGKGVVTT